MSLLPPHSYGTFSRDCAALGVGVRSASTPYRTRRLSPLWRRFPVTALASLQAAVLLLLGWTGMGQAADQPVPAEWIPTLVILPFRELATLENQPGITAAEWLTLRLSSEALRILDPDADRDVLREVEIGLLSGRAAYTSQREGVDGVVTGDIIVHQDRWLLTAKLTSLADESVRGVWVEAAVSDGLKRALDDMTEQLALRIAAWSKGLKTQRTREWEQQQENLGTLATLTGGSVVVDIQESYSRDHRLLAGFSEGAILALCAEAGLALRSKHDLAAGLLPAGTLIVRGEATCDEPVHRDGRAVATAMCKLSLYRPESRISLAEATVCRTFAAGLAREAGKASLESAGRNAFLHALEGLRRSGDGPSGDGALTSAQPGAGSPPQRRRPARPLCLEIADTGNPLLVAIRETMLLMLADDPDIRPMIRTLTDPAQPYAAAAGPSVADLRRPASLAIILAREANILWGRVLDTRTGELLAASTYPLGDSLVSATDELTRLFRQAADKPAGTSAARWIRTVDSPFLHEILLRQPGVRVLPAEYERILLQERGLGQEAAPLAWDLTLRHETFSGRESGIDGATVRIVAEDSEGKALGEGSVFLAAGASFESRKQRLTECVTPLLRFAVLRPAREGDLPAAKQALPEVLAFAKAESESQRVVDWYRTHGGDGDDAEVQALDILAKPCTAWSDYRTRTWHGSATRAATARLRWEIANNRVRDRRAVDRWFVYRSWAHWREVPRSDAETLTDAYLRAYYTQDDDSDPANPDLLLTFQIIETGQAPGLDRWRFREPVPTFRQNDFRRALARSGNSAVRRLATEEWPMLCAIWRRDVVSPEEHGAALVKALATANSLSRLLLHLHAAPARNWYGSSDEEKLTSLVENSIRERVEATSATFYDEDHKGNLGYTRSAARFHAALKAYLTSAPRPLPPLILWAVRKVVFSTKGRQFGLKEALREEDGIQPRPHSVGGYTPAHPSLPDGPLSPSDWPIEWMPCPLKESAELEPLLEWVHDGVLYQGLAKGFGYVTADRWLRVLWCDIRTARWGLATNVNELLEQATGVRTLKDYDCGFFRVNGHSYLTSRWQTLRIEADGTLTKHAPLPPGDARWDLLVECGNGVLFADNGKARLRYWDAAADSIIDLANHASTTPGPLNNQQRWKVLGLHHGSIPGQCDAIVLCYGPWGPRGGFTSVARQIRVNCVTREVVLVRTIQDSGYRDRASLSDPDALYIPGAPPFSVPPLGWRRVPRDPTSPHLHLPETTAASSIAASARRLFANRVYGKTAERYDLSLRDGLTEDDSRVVTVKETRVNTPSLLRIGDDLVLIGRMASGIRVIRDAFTRELPPEGTDIQLHEVEFRK